MSEKNPKGIIGEASDGRMTYSFPYKDGSGTVLFQGRVAQAATVFLATEFKPVSAAQLASDLGVSKRGVRALVSGVREGFERAGVDVVIGREKQHYFVTTHEALAGRDPGNDRQVPTIKGEIISPASEKEIWRIDIDDLPLVAPKERKAKSKKRNKGRPKRASAPGSRHGRDVYQATDVGLAQGGEALTEDTGHFQESLLGPHRRAPGGVSAPVEVFSSGVPMETTESIVSKLHLPDRKGRPIEDATLNRKMRDFVNEVMNDPRLRMGATPLQMGHIFEDRVKGYAIAMGDAFELTEAGRHRQHEVVAILTYMFYGTRLSEKQQEIVVPLAEVLTRNKRDRQKNGK